MIPQCGLWEKESQQCSFQSNKWVLGGGQFDPSVVPDRQTHIVLEFHAVEWSPSAGVPYFVPSKCLSLGLSFMLKTIPYISGFAPNLGEWCHIPQKRWPLDVAPFHEVKLGNLWLFFYHTNWHCNCLVVIVRMTGWYFLHWHTCLNVTKGRFFPLGDALHLSLIVGSALSPMHNFHPCSSPLNFVALCFFYECVFLQVKSMVRYLLCASSDRIPIKRKGQTHTHRHTHTRTLYACLLVVRYSFPHKKLWRCVRFAFGGIDAFSSNSC